MGFLTSMGGKALGSPIEAVGNALDKLFTSDAERAQAAVVMERLRQEPHVLQAEINKVEAAHNSVFVAGWRPALGWVCALSLATYYLPQHVLAALLWLRSCWGAAALAPYPIGTDSLMELVFALLGLGFFRSAEKFGGVAGKH